MPYFRWLHIPMPVRGKSRSKSKEPVAVGETNGGHLAATESSENGDSVGTQDQSDEQVIQKTEIYLEIDSNSTVVES